MKEKSKWFMVKYSNELYGLKAGDGIQRGVPEGSKEEWLELINAMKNKEEYNETRLAYIPGKGIYSPRNTNSNNDIFKTSDANLIKILLDNSFEWAENNLPGNQVPLRK